MERLVVTQSPDEFIKFLNEDLIYPYFRKGIPSVFNEIKRLYSSPEKSKIIETVLEEHANSLEKHNKFNKENIAETPVCLLWCYYVLSQHFDYCQNYEAALKYIDLVFYLYCFFLFFIKF